MFGENPAPQSSGKTQTENSSFATLVRLSALIDPSTGKTLWEGPGGGSSTPGSAYLSCRTRQTRRNGPDRLSIET